MAARIRRAVRGFADARSAPLEEPPGYSVHLRRDVGLADHRPMQW